MHKAEPYATGLCFDPIRPVAAKCVDRSGSRQSFSTMEDAPGDKILLARLNRNAIPVDDECVTALHDGHILVEVVSMRLGCR